MPKKKKAPEAVRETDVNGHELLIVESDGVTFEDLSLVTGLTERALINLNPQVCGEIRKGDAIRIS